MDVNSKKRLEDEIKTALSEKILRKAVLSRSREKSTLKTVAVPFEKDGVLFVLDYNSKCNCRKREAKR